MRIAGFQTTHIEHKLHSVDLLETNRHGSRSAGRLFSASHSAEIANEGGNVDPLDAEVFELGNLALII